MKAHNIEPRYHRNSANLLLTLLLLFLTGCATTDTNSFKSHGDDIGWDDVPGILARIVPPAFPDRDFNLTKYGAVADNATDIKPALDKAIADCHAAGGGRVVVPAGDWCLGHGREARFFRPTPADSLLRQGVVDEICVWHA